MKIDYPTCPISECPAIGTFKSMFVKWSLRRNLYQENVIPVCMRVSVCMRASVCMRVSVCMHVSVCMRVFLLAEVMKMVTSRLFGLD